MTNTEPVKTKFFYYRQNLVGDCIEQVPGKIGVGVIIEAENWQCADMKARQLGLYFNGTKTGRDCECCGDRWISAEGFMSADSPHAFEHKCRRYTHNGDVVEYLQLPVYVHYTDRVTTMYWRSEQPATSIYDEVHD